MTSIQFGVGLKLNLKLPQIPKPKLKLKSKTKITEGLLETKRKQRGYPRFPCGGPDPDQGGCHRSRKVR